MVCTQIKQTIAQGYMYISEDLHCYRTIVYIPVTTIVIKLLNYSSQANNLIKKLVI